MKLKKFLLIMLALLLVMCMTGCDWFKKEEPDEIVTPDDDMVDTEEIEPAGEISIESLKQEFLGSSVTENTTAQFKPFYNVEQTTQFTFHFNSKVDPMKAITVHTDSKCEETSTVFTLNDGYMVNDGVDVVVNPAVLSVLTAEGRNNNIEKNAWGYAPIYYLCIRYDLDSTEVKKLDEPIIVPFTVKSEISAPNTYLTIEDGMVVINWLPVKEAVSYKIYTAVNRATIPYSPVERGYIGERLKLVSTVSGDVLKTYPVSSIWKDNMVYYTDGNKHVRTMNCDIDSTYYVTAVDAAGNESLFGYSIRPYLYASQLPEKLVIDPLTLNEEKFFNEKLEWNDHAVLTFLDEVEVLYKDGTTKVKHPINFYKDDDKYAESLHKCYYRYEVVDTKLSGVISYYNASGEFPEEHISSVKGKGNGLQASVLETIPSINVSTVDVAEGETIDLSKPVTYPPETRIKLDEATMLIRADMESARIIKKGVYGTSPDTIESYLANDNPEFIVIKEADGTIIVKENENYVAETKGGDGLDGVKNASSDFNVSIGADGKMHVTKSGKSFNVEQPTASINANNMVDKNRESTKKDVEEGNKKLVPNTNYPIVAQTAGQKYLALALINQEEKIDLKAFPEYKNMEKLSDDLLYVWYQNPYIMGVDFSETTFASNLDYFKPKYFVSKETAQKYQQAVYKKARQVAGSITNASMTDNEKVFAIYDYLEKNGRYNYEALEYANQYGGSAAYAKYPNAWNTYGILCEGYGVCQSFSYAFNAIAIEAGLDTAMATGFIPAGGHAWNVVEIDGKWYVVDVTNNGDAVGVPYWICLSSYDFMSQNGFAFDDGFVVGQDFSAYTNGDDTQDWYTINDSAPKDGAEAAKMWLDSKSYKIYLKHTFNSEAELNTFRNEIAQYLKQVNYDKADLVGVAYDGGIVAIGLM